ncbi:hypothetical protein GCM10007198_06530 [Microbacterium aerolatum]|uniref:ATPase AAA-type core domain-containing protein n=2 Tax=Microbacterium aerolatum TaxID=153731 RepID=A0A511AES3_9MICO|nr:hypothetical protein MAE01_18340 [Microbacterium aerolatum]GGB18708.1 hypothetical protein GCM10007198_06530 [Microbacterium aerolatum]
MTLDLQQLGPTGFQDLAGAIALSCFGPGVQVMGAGRDGGRDLYYRGRMPWSTVTFPGQDPSTEVWDGYSVIQVKHRQFPSDRPEDNASWLWGQIRSELESWADPNGDRVEVPANMLFITNVRLSAFPGVGGHDSVLANIARFIEKLDDASRDVNDAAGELRREKLSRLSRINNWRIWDGTQVGTLLLTKSDVRRGFPAFLTAADVFAHLGQFTDRLQVEELEPALRTHARSSLTGGDGLIYFDEAGSGDLRSYAVHNLAIDLPIVETGTTTRSTVVHYVLDRAEHVLRPGITTVSQPRSIILAGAPGNGKTTISKFLVQAYRAAMLDGADDLSEGQRAVVEGTRAALIRMGRGGLPLHRRWPMRIDLAEYAQQGGLDNEATLLKWIAKTISKRLNAGQISPSVLDSWMRQWPCILILDGLDEVTELSVRKRLIEQITEFVDEAEATKSDVFVVLTTRPLGFTENIAPGHFGRVDLADLPRKEALKYGILASRVRLQADPDRLDRVIRQLRIAAKDESLKYLFRTPLQVLILAIIIEGSGPLAPDRFSLFSGYYETVAQREKGKVGGHSHLLRDHASLVHRLHERVGFELQVRSENADRSLAVLSFDELKAIAWNLLLEHEFQPSGRDSDLLRRILEAVTHRLVLIVPRREAGYGYDVRSLQELMAAMLLTSGPLESTVQALRVCAPSPHWRNTWLFAAGRLFATPQPHLQSAVIELIESLDDNAVNRLAALFPVGPRLALDVIDDGMARSSPKWRARLMRQGVRVLQAPATSEFPENCRIMIQFADADDRNSALVADGIRDAMAASGTGNDNAWRFKDMIHALCDETGAGLRARGLAAVLPRPTDIRRQTPLDWDEFEAEVATAPLMANLTVTLAGAGQAVRSLAESATDPDVGATILLALEQPGVATALAQALHHVVPSEPVLTRALQEAVLPAVHRHSVGDSLRDILAD